MSKNDLIIQKPKDFLQEAFVEVSELEKISIDSTPIVGDFLLKGQVSFVFAPANSGKTLILMNLLKDSTEEVHYFNADDGIAGGVEKVKIAEELGFKMILCGTKDTNEPKAILDGIRDTLKSQKGYFQNKVLVFDTVKKFVNPLDKSKSASFLKLMREITLDGGSVVLLGHTNKGYTPEGELIFEGTGDWLSDVDCAYALYPIQKDNSTTKELLFKNEKSRGNVPSEFTYVQDNTEGLTYKEKIDSIMLADKELVEKQKQELIITRLTTRYEKILEETIPLINDNPKINQSSILEQTKELLPETVSKAEISRCLDKCSGIFWLAEKNPQNANAKEFVLIHKNCSKYLPKSE